MHRRRRREAVRFRGLIVLRGLPVLGAVLVVLGFWIGGKVHPAGFILAAIPIGAWAALHAHHAWLRTKAKAGRVS